MPLNVVVDKYGIVHELECDLCNKLSVELLCDLSIMLSNNLLGVTGDTILNLLWGAGAWGKATCQDGQQQSCMNAEESLTQLSTKDHEVKG